jgi:hypothetical protein
MVHTLLKNQIVGFWTLMGTWLKEGQVIYRELLMSYIIMIGLEIL